MPFVVTKSLDALSKYISVFASKSEFSADYSIPPRSGPHCSSEEDIEETLTVFRPVGQRLEEGWARCRVPRPTGHTKFINVSIDGNVSERDVSSESNVSHHHYKIRWPIDTSRMNIFQNFTRSE